MLEVNTLWPLKIELSDFQPWISVIRIFMCFLEAEERRLRNSFEQNRKSCKRNPFCISWALELIVHAVHVSMSRKYEDICEALIPLISLWQMLVHQKLKVEALSLKSDFSFLCYSCQLIPASFLFFFFFLFKGSSILTTNSRLMAFHDWIINLISFFFLLFSFWRKA